MYGSIICFAVLTCDISDKKKSKIFTQTQIFLSLFAVEIKMSSRKTATRRATTKKRAQRATSNVFAMFDQAQIAEFKVSLTNFL